MFREKQLDQDRTGEMLFSIYLKFAFFEKRTD